MLKTNVLLVAVLVAQPAFAAETPWSIPDQASFQRRSTLQLAALGGVAAGAAVIFASGLAPSGSGARNALERSGLVLAGASVITAGLHLPTLTAFGWREKRYAWSHPFALVGTVPMLLLGGCAVGWGVTTSTNEGVGLGYTIGMLMGFAGSLVTHVPGMIGPLRMNIEQPPRLGLQLLPPMTPWESSTVAAGKRVPAATLTARW